MTKATGRSDEAHLNVSHMQVYGERISNIFLNTNRMQFLSVSHSRTPNAFLISFVGFVVSSFNVVNMLGITVTSNLS